MKQTTNYSMFGFRKDNRAHISQKHVDAIAASIELKNMLEFRPIVVNEKMEIIDGQNRLLAAKKLGVPIYYEIQQGACGSDIIAYNLAKSWSSRDYLNYYCVNGYPEYQKLQKFMETQGLGIQSALALTMKKSRASQKDFRLGKYIFDETYTTGSFQTCLETIDKMKCMIGFCFFTKSSRFWKALIRLTTHDDFSADKWFKNMNKFIERFTPKASAKDYLRLFVEVHNHGNQKKILLHEEEYFPADEFVAPKSNEGDPRQLFMRLPK